MTDQFEQTLQDTINKLAERIKAAEDRIMADQEVIDSASKELLTFQALLTAYTAKKQSDSEALAAFYISGRQDDDIDKLCKFTGIGLPAELKQSAEPPPLKETGT